MNRFPLLLLCIVLLHTSCKRSVQDAKTGKQPAFIAKTTDSQLVLSEKVAADSLEKAFEQDKCFFPTIISLSDDDSLAFIATDSALIPTKVLTNADRWDYYKRARKLIPEQLLRIHKRIWQLPEVRFQQAGNGGLYTVVTMITDTPQNAAGCYSAEVRRNYVWRFGAVADLCFMHYYPATDRIEIMNREGKYLPLKAWRKWIKKN